MIRYYKHKRHNFTYKIEDGDTWYLLDSLHNWVDISNHHKKEDFYTEIYYTKEISVSELPEDVAMLELL